MGDFVGLSRRHRIGPAATTALFTAALLAIVTIRTQSVPAQTGAGQSPATGLIAGRVVEVDGKTPIAAVIVALSGGGGGPFAQDANRVLTDADGRFFVSDVAAGSYSLTAEKPGLTSKEPTAGAGLAAPHYRWISPMPDGKATSPSCSGETRS